MDTNAIGNLLGARFEAVSKDAALALQELQLDPATAKVLDVGTGKGNFAIYLALRGFDVLTGEPESDQSIYARQDWAASATKAGVRDRIRFQPFEANHLPFEEGDFDAVFFFGVLHHIDEAVRREVLREALRAAKAGTGAVVFFEPRQAMLEQIWVDDPAHPLAADPSDYLPEGGSIAETRIEGSLMDLFIYRRR